MKKFYDITIETPEDGTVHALLLSSEESGTDRDIELAEAVVRWCSRNGYTYDDCNWDLPA